MSADTPPFHGVSIVSVWEDESLFEVLVRASNGEFSGEAGCYTTREHMRQLAASVDRFPASVDAQVSFSSGPSADFSYFSLHFSCIDGAGHVVLRVKIAEIIRWSNGRPTNNVVEFDVPVEPAAIDRFASALATISDAPIGTVTAELNAGP